MKITLSFTFLLCAALGLCSTAMAQEKYDAAIDKLADKYEAVVIQWRHDIHQHPELSNREFRTAKLIADHLRSLKFDVVKADIAPTGVIGILKGGEDAGRQVALGTHYHAEI